MKALKLNPTKVQLNSQKDKKSIIQTSRNPVHIRQLSIEANPEEPTTRTEDYPVNK